MPISPAVTETVYSLTGSNVGPFSTVWPYEEQSDVVVFLDRGQGLELLSNGAQYTQADAGSGPLVGGGTVTVSNTLFTGSWPDGAALYLLRAVAGGQPSAFGEAGSFSPAANEEAINHTARQIQELKTLTGRAIAVRPGETLTPLPAAAQRAGGLLGFDENGMPIIIGGGGFALSQSASLLIPNIAYSIDASAASLTFGLMPLASVFEGAFVEIDDAAGASNMHPITINAHAGDSIEAYGVTGSSITINRQNTISRFRKRNGVWRFVQYGG